MSSPARRDFDVVTYFCVVMNHLGSAMIEEAAAAGASPSPLPVLFRSLVDPGVEELLGTAGMLLARVDESIEEYPIHDGSAR